MSTENTILGLIDLGGESGRAASVRMNLLHKTSMRLPHFRIAGTRIKPQDVISFLRAHAARTRRRTMPVASISLDVFTPSGKAAVEIIFKET
jgi:hypothetical protein